MKVFQVLIAYLTDETYWISARANINDDWWALYVMSDYQKTINFVSSLLLLIVLLH